jgi:hypothetical protein
MNAIPTPRPTLPVSMRRPKPSGPQTRVLVVLDGDGFVSVYAPRGVSIHIAQRLATQTDAAAILADELLDRRLPRRYQSIYCPGNLRATGLVERRIVADEADRLLDLALLREVQSIGRDFAGGDAKVPVAIAQARRSKTC